MWRIECTCDVLMSFKDKIKALNCFVARNEFKYDSTINDELVPIDSEFEYLTYGLTQSDSANLAFTDVSDGDFSTIISVLEEKEG